MSSYNNLNSVTKTVARKILTGIKNDKELKDIIKSEKQITFHRPEVAQTKSSQLSIFLYNITELSSMRNQPQAQGPEKPRTLLRLNLHYLITPVTENAETDQIILGKIMQLLAETPVLRGPDLQGSLRESCSELRINLDELKIDELNKLWTMFATPYRLCTSYSVYPVPIESSIKTEIKNVQTLKKPQLKVKKQAIKKNSISLK